MMQERTTIFGLNFLAAESVAAVVQDILQDIQKTPSGKTSFLITPNASQIVYFSETAHKDIRAFLKDAPYILPDGMPIVWLSKLKSKKPLKARLTGSDLFPVLWRAIKEKQYPATLILANEELAERFREEYSHCNVFVPDMFDAGDQDYYGMFSGQVAEGIIANRSRFLFLGLGFPRQERLGIAIADALKQRGYDQDILILLLGASFEFYFGIKQRAPIAFQKTGMEWLYRFLKEPRRLWKRYTIDNLRFLAIAMKEVIAPRKD
jgi:N-acetylglucosaminyldiphosphoundecaprenol N-acetyl-beta-D-mannosaminyltransferase